MQNFNWNEVREAEDFETLMPGGYICGITKAEDCADKQYLRLEYDIAEGPYKNHWRNLSSAAGFWGGVLIRSYKEKARPFFKQFITCVQASNPGYVFQNDENTLLRKKLGLVLGEEEYKAKDGTVKKRLYVAQVKTIKAIQEGDYTVPALKHLPDPSPSYPSSSNGFEELSDSDLPF